MPNRGSLLVCFVLVAACGGPSDVDAGAALDAGSRDAGAGPDAGNDLGDAGEPDAGEPDAGALDAGVASDGGTDGGADAGASDAGSGDAGEDFDPTSLYQACDGNTLFPTECEAEACVDADLERRVYDIWRARFMTIHGLTAAEMDARIVLSDVSIADGPTYVWWRVDYVFVLGWARSRQSESVNLGDYPLSEPPSDDDITRAVNLAIEEAERFDMPSVAPLSAVRAELATCAEGMTIDWCSLDFVNVTGELRLRARKPLSSTSCQRADVDVGRPAVMLCTAEPCVIM